MSWVRRARVLLVLIAAAAAVALPPMETAARSKRAPIAYEPSPPPPPPMAPVGLSDRLLADASAYQAYLQRVMAISPAFTSGQSVAQALRTGAAYEPAALLRGAVAYAAVAALQDGAFVAQVRSFGADADARRLMVNRIIADPNYVFAFKGADGAAGLVKEALGGAALRLYGAGKAVKQSAYDVQHQAWSKETIVDRPGRLAQVKAASESGVAGDADGAIILQRAAMGLAPLNLSASPAPAPYTPLLAHALQLAALAALGEASDAAYDRLTYLTTEVNADMCLRMAKLNLNECLAVAGPHYEDIFCIGQHIMMDTGACLAKNIGVGIPLEVTPAPLHVPALRKGATSRARRRR
ncbi:MAG TPA: hypothetical protein VII73_14050 [Caulobacteraceae bacterium]